MNQNISDTEIKDMLAQLEAVDGILDEMTPHMIGLPTPCALNSANSLLCKAETILSAVRATVLS